MVILADTSVWIDHFRKPDAHLQWLSVGGQLCNHPFVTGELVAGSLQVRHTMISNLRALPQLAVIAEDQFHTFIEDRRLCGIGLSFVDLHLLAAVSAVPDTALWTRDKRLMAQAERLGIACKPA